MFLSTRIFRSWLSWGAGVVLAQALPAQETPTPPAPAAAPATGTYSEKLELVNDASVADSLARQKNLNFDSVRIDGETSEISLSALTADQILNAVATKVATPDLDADAVGGLLQLTSRRAFEQKERTLRGSFAATYDPMVAELGGDASVTWGRSLGARQRYGFLATLEQRVDRDRDEQIELDWAAASGLLDKFQVAAETGRTIETNFNGSFDWKLGEKSAAFFRTEAQFSRQDGESRALEFDLPAALPPAGGEVRGDVRHALQENNERRRGLTLVGGANFQLKRWAIDLRLSHRSDRRRTPEERNYEFGEDNARLIFAAADRRFPAVAGPGGAVAGDPSRRRLEELRVDRDTERTADVVASLDAKYLLRDLKAPGWLKGGIKARFRRTRNSGERDLFEVVGAGLSGSEVTRGATEVVVGGRYRLEGFPDLVDLRRIFDAQPTRFTLNLDKTRSDTDPRNYDVRQDIVAGYVMASLTAGANRLAAGLRAEQTASRFVGNEVAFDELGRYEATRPVAARIRTTDYFPGVHYSRPLPANLTVFASWTRSIRRPEYTDLVPARRVSRANRDIEEGNAGLRSELYENRDAALDWGYRDDGRVSLELFDRDIKDPTVTRRTILTEGVFAGYERERPENGGRARLQGLQFTWQQELAVVSKRLDGLELEFNYTRQRSRQAFENRPGETLPLMQRPEHELNVQLAYDRGPWYASVEMAHTSRTFESIGRQQAEDRIELARSNWDLSISHQFRPGLRVILDVENLTAADQRRYAGDSSRPDRFSINLREYRLGVKWEL